MKKRIPLEVFLVMKVRKNIQSMYQKNIFLSKISIHSCIINIVEIHFCCFCLQYFSTEEILKRQIKDCLKINGKQRITMHIKEEYVKFKNYERKIKST